MTFIGRLGGSCSSMGSGLGIGIGGGGGNSSQYRFGLRIVRTGRPEARTGI